MLTPKKNIVAKISIRYGHIKIFIDDERIASCDFCIEETQIRATDLSVEEEYQRKGYGRVCMDMLKCLATHLELPIILYSLVDAVPFYESIGFEHLTYKRVKEKVIFGDIEVDDKEIKKKGPTSCDFIWMPKNLKEKPIIYF